MADAVDLLTPVQEAFFATLTAAIASDQCDVFVVMPENPAGNFSMIGAMDSEELGEIDGQLEKITVEVQYVYRGNDRRQLLALMAAGRASLDRKYLTPVEGVAMGIVRYSSGHASAVGPDGKTYAGIQNFMLLAQPA